MADDEAAEEGSKTEDPTPRKLEEARRRGQVAVSREMNTWLLLIAGTVVMVATFSNMFVTLGTHMQTYIAQAHDLPGAPGGIGLVAQDAVIISLKVLAIPILVLMVTAILGPLLQAGPVFAPELIRPDLQKISPIKGFERIFSKRALIEFVKGLVKIGVVGGVTYVVLKPHMNTVEHLIDLPFAQLMNELLDIVLKLMIACIVTLMAFAAADVAYQRYDLYQRLRMTKQELKDEFRQTEGDPMIKGRLKSLRLERARQRMMQNVPKADVIITNPTHYAVALQYVPEEMEAPKLLAKGADKVAARIREAAKAHNIEIVENPPLARGIYESVEIDATIPPEFWKAVAEVITYVFRKSGKLKG